jgi:hypothetical protein
MVGVAFELLYLVPQGLAEPRVIIVVVVFVEL